MLLMITQDIKMSKYGSPYRADLILLRVFLLFIPIILSLSQAAKAVEIQWSTSLSDNSRYPYMKIIGSGETGFYILRCNQSLDNYRGVSGVRSRRYWIQYFSEELAMRWEGELRASSPDGKIFDVQVVNGKALVLSYSERSDGNGYNIFGQFLSDEGQNIGQPVLIEEYPSRTFDDDRIPGLIYSKDRSKMALSYRKSSGSAEEQVLCAIVMDTSLQRLYRKEWTIPSPIKRYSPAHSVLTNEGNFYVLGIQFLSEKKIKGPGESYFNLTGYFFESDQIIRRDIQLKDKFLTDVSVAVDNLHKRIVVGGFYSETGMDATAGVFFSALKEDSLTETRIYIAPFTDELLQKSVTESRDMKKKELINYYVDRLILRKDGAAALIAESYVESARTYWDYYTQSMISHTYYRYGNILAASVSPEGKMLWNKTIQKEQNSIDDDGYESSYCSIISGGKFYAIFNKYIDQKSAVLISWIDGQGNQKTETLIGESERASIIARAARQVDEDTVLIPVYKQGKFYLAKVTF